MWFVDPLRSQYWVPFVLLCSINIAMADEPLTVSLDRMAVSCLPSGDWRYQFPAMSRDGSQVAVIFSYDEADDSRSLILFDDTPDGLSKSQELSLPYDRLFTGAECVASIESSEPSMELISRVRLEEINRLFETEEFRSLHPIDARDPAPSILDALDRSTEEVVSWSKYFIAFDYRNGRLTIHEIKSEETTAGLLEPKPGLGRTYVDKRLQPESQVHASVEALACEVTPIPVSIWADVVDEVSPTWFLVHIQYLTSGKCRFPDRWLLLPTH